MARIKKEKYILEKERRLRIKNFKKVYSISKKDEQKLYKGFSVINGYVPKLDILINDKNDYISLIRCKNYNSLIYLINNLQKFNIKSIQNTAYKDTFITTIKFNKTNNRINDLKQIRNVLTEFRARTNEFYVYDLNEIFSILRDFTYREDKIKSLEANTIIKNPLNTKQVFQQKIYAKNVRIIENKIYFNTDSTKDKNYYINNKEYVKHVIYGLQMYPSYLYEGYLTEVNNIKNVKTSTYITHIDKDKALNALPKEDTEQKRLITEVLKDEKLLFNTCFYIHIKGTEEEINIATNKVLKISNKYHVLINDLTMQQKEAYSSFIPLCSNKVKCLRATNAIEGILPYNANLLEKFNNGQDYGFEYISDNKFSYNRLESGFLLSSKEQTKKWFLINEQAHLVSHGYKFNTIDFNKENKAVDINIIDILLKEKEQDKIDEDDLFLFFKLYLLMCLSHYKLVKNIDEDDKENLYKVFDLLEEKAKTENISFENRKERILKYLEKKYNKIYKKISKNYNTPNDKLKETMAKVYYILCLLNNKNIHYIYVNNIQEIVDCLDILLDRIYKDKGKTKFLFTSTNDYALYNNRFVAKKLFNSPYLNIVDLLPNDLLKINEYLKLSNNEITILSDQNKVNGMLITETFEYNYYYERYKNSDTI